MNIFREKFCLIEHVSSSNILKQVLWMVYRFLKFWQAFGSLSNLALLLSLVSSRQERDMSRHNFNFDEIFDSTDPGSSTFSGQPASLPVALRSARLRCSYIIYVSGMRRLRGIILATQWWNHARLSFRIWWNGLISLVSCILFDNMWSSSMLRVWVRYRCAWTYAKRKICEQSPKNALWWETF